MNPTKILAAIDIGTNSFHLVIAEVNLTSGRFRILGKDKEIVRLGSGSTDMKYISETAMNRGIAALKRFCTIAESHSAEIRAIATSAVREALNKDEFLRRVRTQTDIKIEIASGTEEARLIHLGVLQSLPVFNKKILLIDIGGGSTEFLLGSGRKIVFSNSMKLGAVRFTERFFKTHGVNKKSIDECREFVKGSLTPMKREIQKKKFDTCIGSSGTINTLANIIRGTRGEDIEAVTGNNGFTFKKAELFAAVNLILKAPNTRKRGAIAGMDSGRVDIIVAGAIILEQIFKELKLESLTFSEYALREGIILDSIEKLHLKKQVTHLNDIRRSSVLHIAEMYHYEKTHGQHVASLALALFDQTKRIHKLTALEREYLEAAAILHEIGFYVSHALHHRHSYYLIRNADLLGFTENEKEIIANIARYHRKSHPKIKHEGFNMLSEEDRQTVIRLSAILRVADGLDRSHSALVKGFTVSSKGKTTTVKLAQKKGASVEMEVWGAERKKALFESTFKTNLVFSFGNKKK